MLILFNVKDDQNQLYFLLCSVVCTTITSLMMMALRKKKGEKGMDNS